MTISSTVADIRARHPQGMIGGRVESNYLDATRTLINSDPQAYQVSTLVVDTATNSHAYVVTINGVTVTYTADGATTKIEIADGLAAAINADPLVRGQVAAASDGVDTVTLTGTVPGTAFVLSAVDALLTAAAVTTAALAASIPFGRLVLSGGYQSGEANELGILAAAAKLAAQVDTITVDYAANEVYYITIDMLDGTGTYDVAVAADTDDATTATAIRAALNAILPAATVVVTGATDQVIMTAEVAGKAFNTNVGLKSGTIARLALVNTTATRNTDLQKLAAGVSLYTTDEENLTIVGDDATYGPNAGVTVMSKGLVWVACAETPVQGDPVYVELGVTADNGKFFVASSATRVRLLGAQWERDARASSGDNIAVLSLDLSLGRRAR